jgi:YesN/AraC family two-component response regulator
MKLINTDHTTPSEIPKQKFKSEALEINDDIIDRVLSELHKFENKKGFLNKKLTLSTLSKKIKTNPKYLSKIINTHKHKSFRSYINDLRIQYILDCLKNESKFKKYTVKAISEEAGFSNPESFTKAFKKQTELTVSYFLKRVNQTS